MAPGGIPFHAELSGITTMGENTTTAPAPTVPVTKAPRDNALQNKKLANDIAASESLIQSVRGKKELMLALAKIGYDDQGLDAGLALFRTAQDKFSARQLALGAATTAKTARDLALSTAKDEYSAYRQTVQVSYRGADRANLGASGTIPEDVEKFRTTARSAYTAGQQAPYANVLASCGFTPERIAAALKSLDELAATESACKAAMGDAHAATQERDVAGAALNTWMTKFRKLSHIALKNRPELQAQVQE